MMVDIPQQTPVPQPNRQQGIEFKLVDYIPVVGIITALNRNEHRTVSSDADYARFNRYLLCHFLITAPPIAYALDKLLG